MRGPFLAVERAAFRTELTARSLANNQALARGEITVEQFSQNAKDIAEWFHTSILSLNSGDYERGSNV